LKNRRSRVGVICCALLFIAVCLLLVINMNGALPVSGNPELGLLLFTLPGIVGGWIARRRKAIVPLFGAVLAAPFCYVLIHLHLASSQSHWQVIAWLFSAIFWCGIGGLFYLFVRKILRCKK